jgi:hypothetical protein
MAIDYATHHAEMEKALIDLVQKFAHELTPAELAEVTEYLAAREYGLALEEFAGALLDHDVRLHPHFVEDDIRALARAMEIERRPFMRALAQAARRKAAE